MDELDPEIIQLARDAEARAKARLTEAKAAENPNVPIARTEQALQRIDTTFVAPTIDPRAQARLRAFQEAEALAESERKEQALVRSVSVVPSGYRVSSKAELEGRVHRPKAIAEMLKGLEARTVLFWGATGSGKSTLAGAGVDAWVRRRGGGHVVWTRALNLAAASRYHALGQGEPRAILAACRADLLVVDELGPNQRSAQWDDVANVVFDRYENGRPTWFTTWMTKRKFEGEYGDGFARRVFEGTVIQCGLTTLAEAEAES